MAHVNPKNHLQEICQCFNVPLPLYTTKKLKDNEWECTISIGKKYTLSKVDAEKNAAEFVLQDIFLNESDSE